MLRLAAFVGLGLVLGTVPAMAKSPAPVAEFRIPTGDDLDGWKNLSGLAADPQDASIVYAVPDTDAGDPRILKIDISAPSPKIVDDIRLWACPLVLDLEGVTAARDGSFWVVSEGKKGGSPPNWLLHVDRTGRCLEAYRLPHTLAKQVAADKFGFEGVSFDETSDPPALYVALQKPTKDHAEDSTLIAKFVPQDEAWSFFYYPLYCTDAMSADGCKAAEPGGDTKIGVSEIVSLGGGAFAAIERDNKGGHEATQKWITTFQLPEAGAEGSLASALDEAFVATDKRVAVDLVEVFKRAKRHVATQIEGLAITPDNHMIVVTDEDEPKDAVLIDFGDACDWRVRKPGACPAQ